MKKFKKIFAVMIAVVSAVCFLSFHMSAEEDYTISVTDSRYKYLINEDGTISVGANEHSPTGLSGIVTIPTQLDDMKVTGILKNGFSDQENITSVIIPENITKIDSLAFANCLSLLAVKIPDTITYMGAMPFSNTKYQDNLMSSVDSGFVIIDDYILYLYTGICQKINIPDGIRVIADSAFANNGASPLDEFEITSVNIPDSVEYIGNDAFYNCKSIKTAVVGTGVKEIGSSVFTGSDVTLYGYAGTYVQKYAASNSIDFTLIISDPNGYKYECEYSENFRQYYFSDETSFSKEGIKVYKRFYDGTRTEITDWDFTSTPDKLYAQKNG
jgi:hypothetical protein